MSLRRLLRQECVISRPGEIVGEDDMGDPIYGPDETWTARCYLRTVTVTEQRDGGLFVIEELRLILPPGVTPLPAADGAITVDGQRYTLDGNAWPVRNPRTDRTTYVEAKVKAVT